MNHSNYIGLLKDFIPNARLVVYLKVLPNKLPALIYDACVLVFVIFVPTIFEENDGIIILGVIIFSPDITGIFNSQLLQFSASYESYCCPEGKTKKCL